MFEDPNLLTTIALWAVGQILVAAGIWGGIRADIRNLHREVENATTAATRAHDRLDMLLSHRNGER